MLVLAILLLLLRAVIISFWIIVKNFEAGILYTSCTLVSLVGF